MSQRSARRTSSPATPQACLARERRIDEVAGDPSTVVDDLWRPIAVEQRERHSRGEPLTHGLVELRATSRRSELLLGPLQALLVHG